MKSFFNFMESKKQISRDSILQAAQGVCNTNLSMNCRLFVQLTTKDPDIDNYPKVKPDKIQVGDVLVWGKQDKNYFQWGHYAIYLGNEEILEVPGWNKPMRISKFLFPKTLSIVGYGKPEKIVRPKWIL